MEKLLEMNGKPCDCGRAHRFSAKVISGSGVLSQLPQAVKALSGTKAYIFFDPNTYEAAGKQACRLLQEAGIEYVSYCLPWSNPEPDETSVGAAMMHFDYGCDIVIGVGSGVVNDVGKLVSAYTKLPYIIVATAPSMDGYASATSSMNRDGLKISLPSKAADVIIGDSQVLSRAPLDMMRSGLGDMLAKYVSICEWRISHLINGEYYCEEVASLIRHAVKRCVDNVQALLHRDEQAALAVFEGLVIGGVAMNYAGASRPASGVEHYISHVLDMRGVEFGTPIASHGTQCAIGTLTAVELYEKLKTLIPNKEKALAYVKSFDYQAWAGQLREFLGKGAEAMISLEEKEKKYDPESHARRLEKIIGNWDGILSIIHQELPDMQELKKLMETAQMPMKLCHIGLCDSQMSMILKATKDIRDKYVWSRLAWDLGILDEMTETAK